MQVRRNLDKKNAVTMQRKMPWGISQSIGKFILLFELAQIIHRSCTIVLVLLTDLTD